MSRLEHRVEKSNHIEGLDYDRGNQRLRVHFKNGSKKTFAGVPYHVYEEMCGQGSAGRYFHNVIRLHYKCVEDDSDEAE